MANYRTITVALTGSTAGSVAYSTVFSGQIESVRLSSGTTISSTAVITIANEVTDENVFAKAAGSGAVTYRPVKSIVDSTGGAITGTYTRACFANARARVTVGASTASSQSGTLKLGVV
jgi:hypothetical protein